MSSPWYRFTGHSTVVFFTTAVIVGDGAEAPFNFLTVLVQALAYIITVIQAGLRGNQISKFHAYYGLLCSLGFLAPLTGIALTPNSLLYGGRYPPPGQRMIPMVTQHRRLLVRLEKEVEFPRLNDLEKSTWRKQGSSARPDHSFSLAPSSRAHHSHQTIDSQTQSTDFSLDSDNSDSTRVSKRQSQTERVDPQRLNFGSTPNLHFDHDIENQVKKRRAYKNPGTPELIANDSTLQDLSSTKMERKQYKTLVKRRPISKTQRRKTNTSISRLTLSPEEETQAQIRLQKQGWRRRGYLIGFVILWISWLTTFLLVIDIGNHQIIKFIQSNCQDPIGTKMILISNITLLSIGLFVFIFFVAKQILLWTCYDQATHSDSSLQAVDEQAHSLTSILAFTLVTKPSLDLM
ncbi:hypothetical protein OIO90_001669 [Microbotryomycetes sp. JL221]|nr:hypothetical protein OIO90_001669 [Microbotryomycetes sp. JL221]